MAKITYEKDPIEPFIYPEAEILILGTFPAPKARETGFYYAHPTNRFWPVLSDLFNSDVPVSNEDKKEFLRKHKIALWNMCGECYIEGSKDSSIKDPVINDIPGRIKNTNIKMIFTSGKLAQELYRKYAMDKTGIEDIYLPSTSSINQRNFPYDKLLEAHKIILEYL